MKKILAIMGSPRLNGNTQNILKILEKQAPYGYELEIINLVDYNIQGCLGCSQCQHDLEEFKCVQDDHANTLLKKIIDADGIIYGTPLYGHNYSGQLKIFLDRHIPLFKFVSGADKAVNEMEILSAIKDKPVSLLVSCQGPIEYNTELIQLLFDKFCESSLTHCFGKYIFPFCDTDANSSNYDDAEIQKIWNNILYCQL